MNPNDQSQSIALDQSEPTNIAIPRAATSVAKSGGDKTF